MYSEKDYTQAKSALRKFTLIYSLLALVLAGTIATDQYLRYEWLTYVAACLLAASSVFLWGTIGVRLIAWNRFIRDMQHGLERSVTGEIASIDDDEAVKEGLEFRAVHLLTGEDSDKAGGRLLYADVSRFPLKASVGQKVCCRIYGNFIKDITALEVH